MIFLLLMIMAFLFLKIQDNLNAPEIVESVTAACPGCAKEVELDWMVCPHCLQRLRENCPQCHQRKMIIHLFCPSCGSRAVGQDNG
ncbi:double zinc ribbon domain-containing protein [Geopsychrobacter electrodiphilus]|uniref:double zinc ribbon domain-containing protein n=1 Tax=Geopsychrobacter electrodiphilus TaxID=225196 RepID=UPI00037DF7D6|nr:zinc ribbon domain-containing protein [Geopsychrobacter electrodiphilus]